MLHMENVENLGDEELVELVCFVNKELYTEVVRRYQTKLFRYANYLVQNEAKAADVVQEAFIKAYINLRGFDTKRKFSSWIYRITHNEALNTIKRYKKELLVGESWWFQALPGKEKSAEEDFEALELKETLTLHLNKLAVKYKAPLAMFYLEDKSYREISHILRIPISTVGVRIKRGKERLKTICQKKD